jgi:hypothetical protein
MNGVTVVGAGAIGGTIQVAANLAKLERLRSRSAMEPASTRTGSS